MKSMFELGQTVQVISPRVGGCKGQVGVIECIDTDCLGDQRITVHFDDIRLRKDITYWFAPDELTIYKKNIMEDTTMFDKYKRAGIKFLDNENTNIEYQYALYDESVQVGDVVVVRTGHHGFALAAISVVSDDRLDLIKCGREVVTKVDFSAYNERREKAERLKSIKKQMDSKVKELQSYAVYELLAEKDEDLKALLAEFKDLLGAQA
ncbi:MAG: hypothetical protein NC177_14845 [Ruminococcus flavefaciens]|nr:hypothetical protein [Ruminococcus flavefaciens]